MLSLGSSDEENNRRSASGYLHHVRSAPTPADVRRRRHHRQRSAPARAWRGLRDRLEEARLTRTTPHPPGDLGLLAAVPANGGSDDGQDCRARDRFRRSRQSQGKREGAQAQGRPGQDSRHQDRREGPVDRPHRQGQGKIHGRVRTGGARRRQRHEGRGGAVREGQVADRRARRAGEVSRAGRDPDDGRGVHLGDPGSRPATFRRQGTPGTCPDR